MKKVSILLAIACILPIFTACKHDDDNNLSDAPEVKTLELKDKALKLTFADTKAPYTDVVLTETGKAIISLRPESEPAATRANIYVPDYIYGTYEVKENIYTIYDSNKRFVCHLQVNSANDVITSTTIYLNSQVSEGVTYAVQALGKVSDSDLTIDLCRNWNIVHTHITIDGAVKASKVFDVPEAPCFNAILDYAKEKAPQLKAELPADMVITDVMFTQTGSFIILFKNGKIFVGNWGWKNEKTGEFSYSWDGDEKIYSYESGKATFTVETYKKVKYYTLTLSASVIDGGKTYNVNIAFNLEEK